MSELAKTELHDNNETNETKLEKAVKYVGDKNIGAQSIVKIIQKEDVDVIFILKDLQIKGSGLWKLFKDVCLQDRKDMLALINALKEDKTITRSIRGGTTNVLTYVGGVAED